MGRISDFLTRDWIESQLSKPHSPARTRQFERIRKAASVALLKSTGNTPIEAAWGTRLRECMEKCELLYANGSPASAIRQLARETVERFVPAIKEMDFTIICDSGAESCLPQPFNLEMPRVWLLAALTGDREFAKKVAAPYRVQKPEELTARFKIRDVILRHALAEDDNGERAFAIFGAENDVIMQAEMRGWHSYLPAPLQVDRHA